MVGDLESVTCLEAIIRNEKTRFSERENAVYALTGGFLRLRHSKGPIDEGVLRTKEKTLVDGLSRFLKDEAFSRSFDVEAIVARYANSGFNATPAQLTKEKLRQ